MRFLIILALLTTGCELLTQSDAAQCKEPELIGKIPKDVVALAKIRCGFKYKNSPCVKSISLVKEEHPQSFHIICKGESL